MTTETRFDSPATRAQSLAELCALTPEQRTQRLEMIRREIHSQVRSEQWLENGISWSFDATDALRAKLLRLAELERQCCSSLQFEVDASDDSGTLHFRILGADPRSGLFDPIRLDVPHDAARASGTLKRVARTGGAAVLASFFVCCVLPIGIAAVAGASIAAPLLLLDSPWVMAATASALGWGIWTLENRRAASRRRAEAGGCGC